jgi:hypothetical protein
MKRRNLVALGVLLALTTIPFALGLAWVTETCQQTIDGTWNVEIWGGGSGSAQCWDVCTLTVASDGAIAAAGSYVDCIGQNSEITGGQLAISSGCVIEGIIETDFGPINVVNGGIIEDKIYFGMTE